MKKLITLSLIYALLLGCSKQDDIEINQSPFKRQLVSSTDYKSQITSFFASKNIDLSGMRSESGEKLTFDFNNLESVKLNGSNVTSIVANQNGYNKSNESNYGIGFQIVDNKIVSGIIVRMINVSSELKQIEYRDLKNNLITKFEINSLSKSVNAIQTESGVSSRTESCGGAVAACIASAYSDLGWTSVLLFVASAFDPLIAVGIAAGCALGCAVK